MAGHQLCDLELADETQERRPLDLKRGGSPTAVTGEVLEHVEDELPLEGADGLVQRKGEVLFHRRAATQVTYHRARRPNPSSPARSCPAGPGNPGAPLSAWCHPHRVKITWWGRGLDLVSRKDMCAALAKPPSAEPKAGPSAAEMGARQREISVSEFFTKNRHLLGFDNPRKALLTCVKEAVDNALDAAEEAGILPEVVVTLEVAPSGEEAPVAASQATRFRVTVIDNGPGIVRQQIPPIFAKLLYGSKFHRLRMSRGQQGIGISAAGMYPPLTTRH